MGKARQRVAGRSRLLPRGASVGLSVGGGSVRRSTLAHSIGSGWGPGLNKSEQRHALAQVICTFKQGRIADRGHDAQQFRASGLNLVIAAIVYWNSTYIADAIAHLRDRWQPVTQALLAHTSPLTWEHIGFSGDFLWDQAAATAGRRRQLNFRRPRVTA